MERYLIKFLIILFAMPFVYNSELKAQLFIQTEIVRDTIPSVIEIKPSNINVPNDTSRFYSTTVKVLNRGGGELIIKKVNGSCSCSHGYILMNNIFPLSVGELRLEVNKDGLIEEDDTVIFSVESNAKNSPYHIIIKFVKSESKVE